MSGDIQYNPNSRASSIRGDFGDYYDGETALRQRVAISVDDGEYGHVIQMELPDGEHLVLWPVTRVRSLPDQSNYETLVLGLDTGATARLVVRDSHLVARLLEACPYIGETVRPRGLLGRAMVVTAGGTLALAALFLFILPFTAALLASQMKPEAEVALGNMAFEQTRTAFGGDGPLRVCNDPAGVAAMGKLAARVALGVDLPYPIKVAVLDDRSTPTLNAYAVAGGYVTFFDTMIQQAQSPEEIAAVFAHELGHVVNDDPVRGTLQSASAMVIASLLIGDVTGGGVMGAFAGTVLTSSYSRDAETEADSFAHDQLTRVGLPPSALGTMFSRLRARYGDSEGIMAHLASHPQLADRIVAAESVGDAGVTDPVLTPDEWAALRGICGARPGPDSPEDQINEILNELRDG